MKIRIGGVPEHFNYPWHMALETGEFGDLEIEWHSFPGGTGQMTQALAKDECDICMVLTEGAVSAISSGNPSFIISGYVQSPLIWGIHTATDATFDRKEIFKKRIAISRYGSGSHLMAIVHSIITGKKLNPGQFVVVDDIQGAVSALNGGQADIFYWEKYTTKPLVDKGVFRRLDEFITPWPCFVIVATSKFIQSEPAVIDRILRIIHGSCEKFMAMNEAPEIISERYDLSLKDARHWFHATEWYTNSWVSNKMLRNVAYTLKEAHVLDSLKPVESLLWQRNLPG